MDTELPYGSWPSPISAQLVAAGGITIGAAIVRAVEGGEAETWWLELRPVEAGRAVLVSRRGDEPPVDRIDAPWSARTRVHEYGGGAWWLGADHAYFAHWDDQRLYRLALDPADGSGAGPEPEAVTPAPTVPGGWRYADGREHPDGSWMVCVREDHHGIGVGGKVEATNELVAVPLGSVGAGPAEPEVLASGTDFVSTPRFSPDGRWLSWIRWNHPNMPWDSTELCAAPVFSDMRVGNVQVVAGADGDEAIHGADWTADGHLVFSGDRTGFWNLYQWNPEAGRVVAVTGEEAAEIGAPPWGFGTQRWTELADGRLVVAVTTAAVDSLAMVEPDGSLRPLPAPDVNAVTSLAAGGVSGEAGRVTVVAAGPASLPAVVELDVDGGRAAIRRPPEETGIDPQWLSRAEAITFASGPAGEREAHAFFFPPTGLDVAGPTGQAPPLIVMGHGGPTSHSSPALSLRVQYWTSRGFAVVDVNYGGSTGFGRHYRRLLQGAWGIVDVEDCITAASHLAAEGRVDPARMAIRGGSAGGFTVLAALEQSKIFGAGTNLFGVADLTALATDTHKFESRYLDGLIGPYPEQADRYDERSPINHTDRLSSPLLVLQGLEDEIVPPNQSEAIVAAVAAKGIPHAYVTFEGEQHGFRQAVNIIRSFEVELWFYGRVFGFDPADPIEAPAGAVGLG